MNKVLKFFDVKARKPFRTAKYRIVTRKGTRFAVAKSPFTGIECWKILGRVRK